MRTLLKTTSEVMDALGGNAPVAKMTGRTYKAAANWRKFVTFPPNTCMAMRDALHAKGYEASPTLWDMVPSLAPEEENEKERAS